MPELEFTIDTESGEFQLHVHGIAGPACEDTAAIVKELAGEPGQQEATAEYFLRSTVHTRADTRIQTKRS
jgi:hypothetical protein